MNKSEYIWSVKEAEMFLGKRFKDKETDPISTLVPESIRTMKLDSEKVRQALQAADTAEGGEIVLIIGPGGSGKSMVYRAIAHSLKNPLCLAPTGVAALNLYNEGWYHWDDELVSRPKTIQSAIGLTRDYYSPQLVDECIRTYLYKKEWTHILVDEVSMISPNLLDVLIYIAKSLNLPLILFGDPMQLPPVDTLGQNPKNPFYHAYKNYRFWRFFYSQGWMLQDEEHLKIIMLDSVYRQNDSGFKSLLNRARVGEMTENDKKVLESRVTETPPEGSLVLCYSNDEVDKINSENKGKHTPHYEVSKELSFYLHPEMNEGLGFITLIDQDEKDIKEHGYKGGELMFLRPREKGKPDIFEWSDSSEKKQGAENLKKKNTVKKTLELYPGDRIMITRNMTVPLIDTCNRFLDAFLHYSDDNRKRFMFPLDKNNDKAHVVNGSMGFYMGRCNSAINMWNWGWNISGWARAEILMGGRRTMETYSELRETSEEDYIMVHLDTDEIVLIPRATFTKESYNKKGRALKDEEVEQYPIRLAYSITYHKSQGLTLDKVHMMLKPDRPLPKGLGYLGLSRCKTLEGLTLSQFVPDAFNVDEASKIFIKRLIMRTTLPEEEKLKEMINLTSIYYKESDKIYNIPGIKQNFDTVASALGYVLLSNGTNGNEKCLKNYLELGLELLKVYLKPLFITDKMDDDMKKKIVADSDEVAKTFELQRCETIKDLELLNEFLWILNRQKLEAHHKLGRILMYVGENEEFRKRHVTEIFAECDEMEDFECSLSRFVALIDPCPVTGEYINFKQYYSEETLLC